MTEISILPQFDGRYFGQKRILEHLTVLIHWAEQNDEPLPPLLFTGAHGQGQRVLAGLIAERLTIPLYDLCLFRISNQLMCKLTANGEVKRFNLLSDAFEMISVEGMLFLEPELTISGFELDQAVELWSSRGETSDDAIYSFSNLIVRATIPIDVRIFLRRRMAAHFHFGPNDDEGEFELQKQIAKWKNYSIDDEALHTVVSLVGGSDALGEKLLHTACKYSHFRDKQKVDSDDVNKAWKLFGDHLAKTVEPLD